ncbi:hypothetical protein FEM48_Zijuj07G0043000 [Ziziphus jujuba var. spinosa]|uniref:Uncharacterized protein n=1 Tax=Ziziphus jujuba var. spinosa TaxID=714518 RepID=A0A978V2E4_ZIZJJ|nr:hypothetical protein FEM48_Zijuj07G0043000 [Ziziphus jujuba var. spinosa]
MEDRLGVAVSLVNKIISRFVSADDHHHHDNAFKAFLTLMTRYQKKGELKNTKEISDKCAQLFDGHSDILHEDKRKRDGQVEFDEPNNNFFQCDDYDVVGFKHFEEVRKQLCISVEYFQFLMHFSFRISSRDELETMVAPIVASMVDGSSQKDLELIKKFVHYFVGFCKYVEAHDRDLNADKQKKEERKSRKLEKKQSEKPEKKSLMSDCLVSTDSTGSKDALNIYEDKRFEFDMVLSPLRFAIENAEKLQNLIAENTALALETPIDLDKYFTTLDLKCIQSIYDDQHEDVRDILSRDITVGLSIALTRMKCKREEMEHEIVRLREKLKFCLQLCKENPAFHLDIIFWDSL